MDEHFATLNRTQESQADYDLALRHSPRIRFDIREQFLPSIVGYTVFRNEIDSPSFARRLILPDGAACGIEYAIWWDWDIQHLYELEHIWVYLDSNEHVILAEASWHGGLHELAGADGKVPLDNGRVTVYSEPGKHAFAPVADWLLRRAEETRASCGRHAGKGGVLVTRLFEKIIGDRTPLNNQLTWTYLEHFAFEPTFDFSNVFELAQVVHVPWQNLFVWIPGRMKWWTQRLAQQFAPHQRRVIRIAHRGASAYAQENSAAAMRKAVEMGADMVEVDVRLTADRVPVIAHDENLKRVFGISGMVAEFTYDELVALTPVDREPIMTFEQLIAFCRAQHLGLYLDIKQIGLDTGQLLLEIVKKHGMLDGVIFGSFRADWLAEIKYYEPRAMTSVLFSSTHVDPVAQARAIRCDYVHPCWERFDEPHKLLDVQWLEAVRSAGLGVICWHEERPHVIRALQNLGVNGICSDEPDLLLPA
jgi:glycerophosphoryl diester phosphodiesterase